LGRETKAEMIVIIIIGNTKRPEERMGKEVRLLYGP